MFSEFTYIRTAFLFCTATLLAFVSCDGFINEDYDLSKDIDMTVSGLQGLSVPLGSAKAITLLIYLTYLMAKRVLCIPIMMVIISLSRSSEVI